MIINIGPLLIALFAGLLLREGFPRGLFSGSAIAFTGCVIAVATTQNGTRSALGIALCLVAVLAYAAAAVVEKPVLARVSPFQVTWLGCVAGTIACLPFAPSLVTDAAKAGPAALGWTIYLARHRRRGYSAWPASI
jgi:drug/metabolite transporter (DMT)-like permease